MAIQIEWKDGGAGVVLTASGNVKSRDFQGANAEIYVPERLAGLRFQLVDLTRAEGFEITAAQIRAMAAEDRRAADANPRMLIAVVGKDDLVYELSRMWQAYVGDAALRINVVRRREEAERWIAEKLAEDAAAVA